MIRTTIKLAQRTNRKGMHPIFQLVDGKRSNLVELSSAEWRIDYQPTEQDWREN